MEGEGLVGQEIESVGTYPMTWRIAHVFEGNDGITYALLRRRGDESSLKTLALKALMDRKRFTWTGGRIVR